MGGCVSLQISCDQALNHACGCLFGDGNYIHKMEVNLEALEITMQELQERRDDLLRRVCIEEDRGLQRLAQIQGWFSRVEGIGSQVNELLKAKSAETKRLCLFGYCSDKCISSCNYGKKVLKKLTEVEELLSKGVFDVVAQKTPVPKVEMLHIQTTVGLDVKVEMAWNSLMNDERRILGLYGMGGVGKTTLLNRINNKFVELENDFDVVIWVVISIEFQNEGIQDQILGRLRVDKEWKHETEKEKAFVINNYLKRKKFVLLLDDLWSEVDLNKIGVPAPTRKNGSKIVFTTRSKEVCNCMIADEQIKVDCLSPDEAWELFRITVGDIPLKRHHDIPTLARKVAEKCCGLPLALNVIGKSMSCKEDVHEWHHAIDVLNSPGHEFPGMEERILPILKFSYDSLKDCVKLCFLYCSLFPEDYEIKKEKLIEYWICEGFINAQKYEDGGTNQGYDIIGLLVRAHLLIDCEVKTRVKMHDVIREMALWIQSGFGKQQETICVKSGAQVRLIPKHINWEILKRMSLMRTQIEEISCSPNCPNLSTLLLPNNALADISVGFFRFMPQLVVLDLSRNLSLWGVPEEISNLGSLQYLNLSSTRVKSLPVGLQNLRKLIYLNLEFTDELENLVGIATILPNLQVLKLYQSNVFVDDILLEELQRLEHLKVLTANIKDAMILEKIQGVDRLARSIRCLYLIDMSAPDVILNTVALRGLQQLRIVDCNISEIKVDWKSKDRRELSPMEILPSTSSSCFKQLSTVYIYNLKGQKDLSWLLYAQNLTHLTVVWSSQIKEIINKKKGMSIIKLHRDIVVPFENLESLELYELDGLTEICWNYPNLPNCKRFSVKFCPNLAKDIANLGSRAAVASLSEGNPRHYRMKLDVYGEVLQRLQESNYEEATLPDFEDQLWLHFNRLPARYALDVKVERAEDVLAHQRLLKLVEDPAARLVFEVRSVEVSSDSDHAVEVYAHSSNPSSGQRALPPPNFEAITQGNEIVEDVESAENATLSTRPMHEITFATIDKPKLLSQLTSLLGELGLTVQEAHAFSTVDGFSLDIFVVDGWSKEETDGLKDALSKDIQKLKLFSIS